MYLYEMALSYNGPVMREVPVIEETNTCYIYPSGIGEGTYTCPKKFLYKCDFQTSFIMYGTDKAFLIDAWNAQVDRYSQKQQETHKRWRYAGLENAVQEDMASPTATPQTDTYAQQLIQPSLAPATSINAAKEQTVSVAPQPAPSAHPDAISQIPPYALAVDVPAFPRATALKWDTLTDYAQKWATNTFSGMQVRAHVHSAEYSTHTDWNIVVHVPPQENEAAAARLRQYDAGQDFAVEEIGAWVVFTLGTSLASEIFAKEILPLAEPAFSYGVRETYISPKSVIFISNAVPENPAQQDDVYPRVATLSHTTLDEELMLWCAGQFPTDSSLSVHGVIKLDESIANTWQIQFDGLSEEDANSLKDFCKSLGHDIAITDSSCCLPPELSNIIVGKMLLPKMATSFNFGVDFSISTATEILFISKFRKKAQGKLQKPNRLQKFS